MKLININLRFDEWFMDITNVQDSPFFDGISFQATLRRQIWSAEVAKKYGTYFEELPAGFEFGGGFSQIVALGQGNTIQLTLGHLFKIVEASETPDKTTALSVISNAFELFADPVTAWVQKAKLN